MTAATQTLTDFLLARIAEDEAVAKTCEEMFPAPWDIADRGWRVRIYASDVPIPDLMSDDEDATTTRNPVVMEVEPDRNIQDPRWLSERVEHVRRHDPTCLDGDFDTLGYPAREGWPCPTLRALALPYADHPDYREEWRP